jgi:hypothetical protein
MAREVPWTSLEGAEFNALSPNVWKGFNSLFEQGKASGALPRAQKITGASLSGGIHEPKNIPETSSSRRR